MNKLVNKIVYTSSTSGSKLVSIIIQTCKPFIGLVPGCSRSFQRNHRLPEQVVQDFRRRHRQLRRLQGENRRL